MFFLRLAFLKLVGTISPSGSGKTTFVPASYLNTMGGGEIKTKYISKKRKGRRFNKIKWKKKKEKKVKKEEEKL